MSLFIYSRLMPSIFRGKSKTEGISQMSFQLADHTIVVSPGKVVKRLFKTKYMRKINSSL